MRFSKLVFIFLLLPLSLKLYASSEEVRVGAERMCEYLHLIKGKRVAVVANQTSIVDDTHLIDTLKSVGIDVVKAFAPEHGLRGKEDAGSEVKSG